MNSRLQKILTVWQRVIRQSSVAGLLRISILTPSLYLFPFEPCAVYWLLAYSRFYTPHFKAFTYLGVEGKGGTSECTGSSLSLKRRISVCPVFRVNLMQIRSYRTEILYPKFSSLAWAIFLYFEIPGLHKEAFSPLSTLILIWETAYVPGHALASHSPYTDLKSLIVLQLENFPTSS